MLVIENVGKYNGADPIWFPIITVIQGLRQFDQFVAQDSGPNFRTGSGQLSTLGSGCADVAARLVGIWLPRPRPAPPHLQEGGNLQSDPAWEDSVPFFEYFHGDNGDGLGATHQTAWTPVVADLLIDPSGRNAVLNLSSAGTIRRRRALAEVTSQPDGFGADGRSGQFPPVGAWLAR